MAVSVALFGAIGWMVANDVLGESRENRRTARLIVQVISVVIALVIAAQQRRRFRLFQFTEGQTGKLLWPAVAAICAGIALSLTLLAVSIGVFSSK